MTTKFRTLAEYLDATGTTQADFAARVGVQQSLISRILNGSRTPSLPLAIRISEAAAVPVESLFQASGEAV